MKYEWIPRQYIINIIDISHSFDSSVEIVSAYGFSY